MIKTFLLFIALSFFIPACYCSSEENIIQYSDDVFFNTREVIGVVEFFNSSDKLSISAKKYLDDLVPLLRNAQSKNKIIRFEGFVDSSILNNSDVTLAMYRAKSVQDYFRIIHLIGSKSFINGSIQEIKFSNSNKVEIVIYNDHFKIYSTSVDELITSKLTNGNN